MKVLSVHFTEECNLKCPLCYVRREGRSLPLSFFLRLPDHIAKAGFEQVALGGGEPYLFPEFVEEFSRRCQDAGVICNVTTNGTLPERVLRHSRWVTMVSVSFDRYKTSLEHFLGTLRSLSASLRTSVNLLVEHWLLEPPSILEALVEQFFEAGAERVFALHPKLWRKPPVLQHRETFVYLTKRYRHFYVDDLLYHVLKYGSYGGWQTPCHYGRDFFSVTPRGEVTGCSFDTRPLMVLRKPEEIVRVREIGVEPRFSCPFVPA
ncbi:MAG: radical SAM protein [Candidatus Hadarchaeales archaeon]